MQRQHEQTAHKEARLGQAPRSYLFFTNETKKTSYLIPPYNCKSFLTGVTKKFYNYKTKIKNGKRIKKND